MTKDGKNMITYNREEAVTIEKDGMTLTIEDVWENPYFQIQLQIPHLHLNLLGYYTSMEIEPFLTEAYDIDYDAIHPYEHCIEQNYVPSTLGAHKVKKTSIITWKEKKYPQAERSEKQWELHFKSDLYTIPFPLTNDEMEYVLNVFWHYLEAKKESNSEVAPELCTYAVIAEHYHSHRRQLLASSLSLQNAEHLQKVSQENDSKHRYYLFTHDDLQEAHKSSTSNYHKQTYSTVNVDNDIMNEMNQEGIQESDYLHVFQTRSKAIHENISSLLEQEKNRLYEAAKSHILV